MDRIVAKGSILLMSIFLLSDAKQRGEDGVNDFEPLIAAVMAGKREEAVNESAKLLETGATPEQIVRDGLTVALALLGPRCTAEDFNLLEILLAGRAMMYVIDKVVQPRLQAGTSMFAAQPGIVVGTIKGDIHDLGRQVLSVILRSATYRVIDLGKDVEPEAFAECCAKEKAQAIGISSLITVTSPTIRRVKEICRARGLGHIPVVAGGAAVRQASAEYLNVDYVARDVFDGLNYFLREVPPDGSL
ncbi:Cobalamin (vitamin B12)-binding domain protein [Acididesulfobacillus acetoxydans]|uniref:Cobalamin (Vitamin B12)-binding domain protein n=1 Tax=Acididesulfobacillus acetoxydans TaxID=1561005 RepID=A0A8S0W1W9_9FIRM|nr:cobalamin-dependent protein [Acididesulfobacillus acetoxydans]CAA7600058.1 Cobalamin (vitamin B12)-binding domain protein [Acididesulfobacillus acetoxydans]CEJ07833.1 Cobalamin B12-binding domain protein [Acididesulfobacillus acetoxydans]